MTDDETQTDETTEGEDEPVDPETPAPDLGSVTDDEDATAEVAEG